MLEDEIEEINQEIKRCAMQNSEIRGEIELMITLPGVSFVSACDIIAELGSLKQYSARELSALSGLAPRIRESGSSVHSSFMSRRCHDHEFNGKMFSSRKLQQIISEQKAALVKQMKDDIQGITTDDFSLSLHRNGERRNNIRKFVHEAFRDFALQMLKDDGIKFEPSFPAEEAETMIRTVVERLELPDLQSGFFVNVDEAAGKSTVLVKKIDCWKNLLWEFRKRDTSEAQQVFADYFNPITETGPFAEMIEAVAEKIREGIAIWMNETAFDALKKSFIKAMDLELEKCLRIESDHMSLNELDNDAIESMIEKCHDLNNRMKML